MALHHELITPNLRTTSRLVAEKFGKQHSHVLRDIQKLIEDLPEDFNASNFGLVDYIDAKGEARPMYEMTRDGFTLLVMGFTGKPALEWKIRFIEAFNLMEAELAARIAAEAAPAMPAQPPAPVPFGSDMATMEKLSLIRETRLLHGVAAGRRMWAMLDMPNVTAARVLPGVTADPGEGRACLAYLMSRDLGGRAVSAWLAEGLDNPDLNRAGLRVRDDGLFVANGTTVFADSKWSGARHRLALASIEGVFVLPGVLTLGGVSSRGLLLPFAVLAEVGHA